MTRITRTELPDSETAAQTNIMLCGHCRTAVGLDNGRLAWWEGKNKQVVRLCVAHLRCMEALDRYVDERALRDGHDGMRDCTLVEFAGAVNAMWRLSELHYLYRWTAEQAHTLVEIIYALQRSATAEMIRKQRQSRIGWHGKSVFDVDNA